MTSLQVMGWPLTSIFTAEAPFAYLTRALLLAEIYVPFAPATVATRKDGPLFEKEDPHFRAARAPATALAVAPELSQVADYLVTEETEVLLNGKPCRYNEVPDNASILRMELGPDTRSVLRIHFRGAPATSTPPSGR